MGRFINTCASAFLLVKGFSVPTEYLLKADLDFSPVASAKWCIAGSRLIELSCKKDCSRLKRKAGISRGYGISFLQHLMY